MHKGVVFGCDLSDKVYLSHLPYCDQGITLIVSESQPGTNLVSLQKTTTPLKPQEADALLQDFQKQESSLEKEMETMMQSYESIMQERRVAQEAIQRAQLFWENLEKRRLLAEKQLREAKNKEHELQVKAEQAEQALKVVTQKKQALQKAREKVEAEAKALEEAREREKEKERERYGGSWNL